jgi:hypothetical protein
MTLKLFFLFFYLSGLFDTPLLTSLISLDAPGGAPGPSPSPNLTS